MTPELAQTRERKLRADLGYHRIVTALLAALNLGLFGGFFFLVFNQKTVITPAQLHRPFAVGAAYASPEYLVDMSYLVLDLLLNTDFNRIEYSKASLLKLADPESGARMRQVLDDAIRRMKREELTTIWRPETTVEVNERAHTVVVSGALRTLSGSRVVSDTTRRMQVRFRVDLSGRLTVREAGELGADGALLATNP